MKPTPTRTTLWHVCHENNVPTSPLFPPRAADGLMITCSQFFTGFFSLPNNGNCFSFLVVFPLLPIGVWIFIAIKWFSIFAFKLLVNHCYWFAERNLATTSLSLKFFLMVTSSLNRIKNEYFYSFLEIENVSNTFNEREFEYRKFEGSFLSLGLVLHIFQRDTSR